MKNKLKKKKEEKKCPKAREKCAGPNRLEATAAGQGDQ